ncbi:DUF6152 family protein [Caulobacter sp. LARHSG274]
MMSPKSLIAAAAAVVLLPGAALAHHGWSSYDATKTVKVTAPLSDIAWRNPHGEAKLDYAGKTWTVVLAPVARMEARGLTQAMIAGGKPVTLEGYPRKDGVAEMRIERITVDGKTVELR